MSLKPKNQNQGQESNYMNLNDYRNHPWVKTNVEIAKDVPVGSLLEISEVDALRYGGGIPCNCIEIYFKDLPPLLLTDNAMDVVHNNVRYRAFADLMNVSDTTQNGKINTAGGKVTLSGIDSSFLELVMQYKAVRARVIFKVAMLDDKNTTLAMFTEHKGYITFPETTFDPNNNELSIEFETSNVFENLDGIPGDRPADAIQKSYWPTDTGLSHITYVSSEEWQVKQ